MRRVYRAELRDSWPAWASVSLTFVTSNFVLALLVLTANSGYAAVASGRVTFESSAIYTAVPALLGFIVCLVIAPVVGSATSLVVDSRRGSLARLALVGATPGQVRMSVLSQLTAVSLASAAVGDGLALLALQPYLDLLYSDTASRNPGMTLATLSALYEAQPLLIANLLCLAVALIGGFRRAGDAAKVPPVEALRQASAPVTPGRLGVGRWIGAVLLAAVIVGMWVSVPSQLENRYKETASNLMLQSFGMMFLVGTLLAVVAPAVVKPATRAWTRLIPSSSGSWVLARAGVTARAERLFKSVVPIMLTVGIAITEVTMGATLMATLEASGIQGVAEPTTLANLLIVFGMPLLVALAGGVGVLLMMGRQRDADLALAGIAGATPAQRVWLPVLEGLIIVGTGTVLALLMAMVSMAFMGFSLTLFGLPFRLIVPVPISIAAIIVCAVITCAATMVPTLPSRRLPEPAVVARLVAE